MKSNTFTSLSLTKLLFLFFLTAFATSLSAQVKLSVQGLVKKSDGTSLPDGNYDLSFRFYDAENGGAALATETVTTEINGGVYSAILGGGGGLDMLPFDKPYYVSVAVDGGTELLPRIALSAAPYAVSLQGASNKFPSTGTVKADAIDVAGAASVGGALTASGTVTVAGTTTLNGNTNTKNQYADGRVHSNSGFFYHNNGTGNSTGLSFSNSLRAGIYTDGTDRLLAWDDNKNYYRASAGHMFDVGNVSMSGDLTVNNTVRGGSFQRNGSNQGMFFDGGGGTDLSLRLSSGGDRILIGNNGTTYHNAPGAHIFSVNGATVAEFAAPQGFNNNVDNITSAVKFFGIQKGPNSPQVEWDVNTGELQVDNSSRRLKRNIRPMEEDFTKILKVQPKYYNRIGYPDSLVEAGYIAEEFDSLGLQPLVHYYANGDIFGISYDRISLYLTEIVKMHQTDIEKLKAEVAALTAEKNALRTENTSLRADVQNQQANFGKQLDELSRRLKSLETAASNR